VHREHDNLNGKTAFSNLAKNIEAIEVREPQVKNEKIRVVLFEKGENVQPIPGGCGHPCLKLIFEQRPNALAGHVVVFGDNCRDEHGCCDVWLREGRKWNELQARLHCPVVSENKFPLGQHGAKSVPEESRCR
jgi:hypothetical protein